MKKIVWGVAVSAVLLGGCGQTSSTDQAARQAGASASAAGAGQVMAAPELTAKPEIPRVGHRMQLEPVSSDKFNLGPAGTGVAKPSGSK